MLQKEFVIINDTKLEYLVERKQTDRFKIKVYPDQTVKVIAPVSITDEELKNRITKRVSWIIKNLEYYRQFENKFQQEFKSGSAVFYLGKQYRLKVVDSTTESVKLKGKYLVIAAKGKEEKRIENMLDTWYREHADLFFNKTIDKCLLKLKKYGLDRPNVLIRKLKNRWGSCNKEKNKIILNLNLIKERSIGIEYVIMHELCHLKYPSHNNQFYTFLTIVMPDWESRKKQLDRMKV